MIDKENIATPKIKITPRAAMELNLIVENDFYLENKVIRISINGKECDGFTYSLGFGQTHPDDFITTVEQEQYLFKIYMDPFCAFYLTNASIEYYQDFEKNLTGFLIYNDDQKNFTGKFWRKAPEKVPPAQEVNV